MTQKDIPKLLLHIIKLKERIIKLEIENADMKLKLVRDQWNRRLGKIEETHTMKFHTHPLNGWAWMSNQDSRLDYIKFRTLLNHLKKKFQHSLQEWESQPVYTFNTTKEILQKEVETWMGL